MSGVSNRLERKWQREDFEREIGAGACVQGRDWIG